MQEEGRAVVQLKPQHVGSGVVELGPHCWADEPTPRAQPGDRVLVAKFEGCLAKGPADGQTYWFVNDRDIFAAITQENDNV